MRHLKLAVLAALVDGQPRCTWDIADKVGAFENSMSTYLRRIEKQGLIRSLRSMDEPLLRWKITTKGVARLRFFRANPNYFSRRYGGRGKVQK